MKRILYIAEGEIEGKFLAFLKEKRFIQPGRFEKFNLMQNILKDTSNILTNNVDKVFAILDTDCLEEKFLQNLRSNTEKLKTVSKNKIGLLIQNENFEDELKYILNCKDLGKFFKLKNNSLADVKRFLADGINYQNYITQENLTRYCTRPNNFQQKILESNIKFVRSEIVSINACIKK